MVGNKDKRKCHGKWFFLKKTNKQWRVIFIEKNRYGDIKKTLQASHRAKKKGEYSYPFLSCNDLINYATSLMHLEQQCFDFL